MFCRRTLLLLVWEGLEPRIFVIRDLSTRSHHLVYLKTQAVYPALKKAAIESDVWENHYNLARLSGQVVLFEKSDAFVTMLLCELSLQEIHTYTKI